MDSNDIYTEKYYYVYRITNIVDGKHYYGSRTSLVPPHEDIGYKYISSSYDKSFIKEQKEFPENFKYKVVRVFSEYDSCVDFEIFLHEKFNVSENQKFYNQQNQRINGFSTHGKTLAKFAKTGERIFVNSNDERFNTGEIIHFMKGYERSKESRLRIAESKRGIKRSKESREKQSRSSRGNKKPEGFGAGVSDRLSGKPKSKEHRKNLRESLIGYIIVMDDNGNTFKVKKDDERFLNGELKSACFSNKDSIVNVYDDQGNLKYECINENFEKYIKRIGLPYSLIKSYKNNGSPIYQTQSKPWISKLKNDGLYKFKDWYAVRIM